MLKLKVLAAAGLVAFTSSSVASDLKYPMLPLPEALKESDFGHVYSMPTGYPDKDTVMAVKAVVALAQESGQPLPKFKSVLYAGQSPLTGDRLLLDINNPPLQRTTFEDGMAQCASMGAGWDLPAFSEIEVLAKFIHKAEEPFLPGLHWTKTEVDCTGNSCIEGDYKYLQTMNPSSGNVRLLHNLPFIKNLTTCVFRF